MERPIVSQAALNPDGLIQAVIITDDDVEKDHDDDDGLDSEKEGNNRMAIRKGGKKESRKLSRISSTFTPESFPSGLVKECLKCWMDIDNFWLQLFLEHWDTRSANSTHKNLRG
ncbi:Serine/threonine-protein kinase LATS1 [Frankliniella fusca]|uniref:Serine/threonine-protein kinase LATS1 n=1 Tax=Frankliniella fusca TaxID=407009 RepID=A0AAE1LQV7_9NEOP|nr:Serine/threonine-protein kinase LATS1 [Frankliniella fusca]